MPIRSMFGAMPQSQLDPITSGTVPRSSGYVPQHLRAIVGGGGNGVSAGGMPTLSRGSLGSFAPITPSSLAQGAYAPAVAPGAAMVIPNTFDQPVQRAPTGPLPPIQQVPGTFGAGAGALYGGQTSPVSAGTASDIVTNPGASAGALSAPAAQTSAQRQGRPVTYAGQSGQGSYTPTQPVVTTPSGSRTTQSQSSGGGQPTTGASAETQPATSQQQVYTTPVTGLGPNPVSGFNIGGHVYLMPTQLGSPSGMTINKDGTWSLNGHTIRTQVVNGQTVLSVADMAAATGGSANFANGQVSASIPGVSGTQTTTPPTSTTPGNPLSAIPGVINNLMTQGQQDQGNMGAGAQGLGDVGLGLPGSVTNAQGLAQGLAGTSGQVSGTDLAGQQALMNPAALQQLGQMQATMLGAQQMGQLQQSWQNALQQLAARGIAQGGAPGLALQQLQQQALGAQSGEQQQIIAQMLQQQPQNIAAAGNLGAQAMGAAGAPFQQQMQLAGLQDTALGQSMGAYGQMAGQNFGLAQGLVNPLTSYYNAQAMLPYLQSYLPQLAGMMGLSGAGGMMPMAGGTLGAYGAYP